MYENVSQEDKAAGNLPELPPRRPGVSELEDFSGRVNNLRLLVHDLAVPRIKETGKVRFRQGNKHFPECLSIDDFLLQYRGSDYMAEAAKGNFEPRRKVLRTVYFSGYLIWGKPVIGSLERMVMESSRLEYNGKMVNGFPPA